MTLLWVVGIIAIIFEIFALISTGLVLYFVDYRRKEGHQQADAIPMTKAPKSVVQHGSLREDDWKV